MTRRGQAVIRAGGHRQPEEVVVGQDEGIVERQIAQLGHPVIFDLPISDRPWSAVVVVDHRLEQVLPVGADTLRAMFAGEGQITGPVIHV